ncbi:TPA: YfbU family protein, partial [Escherichia coli]|nr:YfbU family protein [Escherichia coli]
LNMYRGLSNAFRKLSDDEQKELVRDHHLKIHDGEIQLPGFDGNNECDYFSIIEAYQKIDRFPEQKQPIANTHSRTEHLYNAMLDEFKKIDAVNRSWDLSKEELASILSTAPRSF